jgi:hypothetical protein
LQDVKISPVTFVVALAGVLFLGGFGWLTFGPKPAPPPPPQLTAEARAYLPNLKLSNVHMQAAESYAQGRLIEILGDVTNAGNRGVKVVEVTCVFGDYSGQPIARERVFVVGGIGGALGPGQTRSFRLPFDTIPDSWNQAMPGLVIAQIQFE